MFYIIFVEPESSGNIGSVARVMKNFGFYDLILVNPVEIDDQAYKLAVHAEDVLKSAKIVPTLEEALDFVDFAIATSANTSGGVLRNYTSVENLAEKISSERESSGLRNEEIEMCDTLTTIPADNRYPTLNVSHALAIILYEIFKVKKTKRVNPSKNKEMVEKDLLIEDFKKILEHVEDRKYRRDNALTVFKHVLTRGFNTKREVYTLKGIFRRIVLKFEGEF